MMKISKCKKELARIISEHGGWRNGEFAAQDGDGGVGGYGEKPVWSLLGKYWRNEAFGEWFVANKIKNHHQTVLSSEEYFHLHPAQDADGWIEWKGGECPVDVDALVCCKWRSGKASITAHRAGSLSWRHNGNAADVIAYRLHKLEQSTVETRLADAVDIVKAAAPALMSDEMKFTGDEVMGEIKPTLDRLLQDWRNADDFAKRKQAEADEAAAMRDERWKWAQVKASKLGVTIEEAGAEKAEESKLAITDWRDLRVGDEVEARCHEVVLIGFITEMEPEYYDGERPFRFQPLGESAIWCTSRKFKFIRRP